MIPAKKKHFDPLLFGFVDSWTGKPEMSIYEKVSFKWLQYKYREQSLAEGPEIISRFDFSR